MPTDRRPDPLTDPAALAERAAEIVAGLSLEAKASLCSGQDFWHTQGLPEAGVPAVTLTDGPHGVRLQAGDTDHLGINVSVPATCFPTGSALAASWDPDLLREVGDAIATECRALGVGVLLGPGVNLKRTPRCGRNFEYLSEDPVLAATLASAFVRGVQARGVGTSLKHLAGNDQETRRMTIDAVYDERTLRELELRAFEGVVRQAEPWAQPWTVMCSYNRLNGVYASEHRWLLTEVLRDEWGFAGIVVTDWGATNDRVAGLLAGCDLEMPGTANGSDARIVAAVEAGHLDPAILDATAERLVTLALRSAAALTETDIDGTSTEGPDTDAPNPPGPEGLPTELVTAHHDLARRAAADGVVLLRNEQAALPIGETDRVALIGPFATAPRYQGTGSSRINPTRLDDLATELGVLVGAHRLTVEPGIADDEVVDRDLLHAALAAAQDAEVVVVHVGLPDGFENEGNDRRDLRLPPSHDRLVAALAAHHDRVVVVLSNGAPVAMPWLEDVEAVVESYLGGQAGAGGLADVLTGRVDPGGRLAESFPRHLDDLPASRQMPGGPNTVEHREGLYIGYRFHTSAGVPALFPFGHGLSYTTFAYDDVRLEPATADLADLDPDGTAPAATVRVAVTNTGARTGREVVQVYVRDVEAAVHRPDRELAAFAKVSLAAGETRELALTLPARSLAYWHPDRRAWTIEPGAFEVLVGASCTDLRGQATLTVPGDPLPQRDEPAIYRRPPHYLDVDVATYEQLLGRPVPTNPGFPRPYTRNTPIAEVADTPAGRVLVWAVERQLRRGFGDAPENEALVGELVAQAPLRTLLMGGVTHEQLDVLVALVNGRWVRGGEQVLRSVAARLRERVPPVR